MDIRGNTAWSRKRRPSGFVMNSFPWRRSSVSHPVKGASGSIWLPSTKSGTKKLRRMCLRVYRSRAPPWPIARHTTQEAAQASVRSRASLRAKPAFGSSSSSRHLLGACISMINGAQCRRRSRRPSSDTVIIPATKTGQSRRPPHRDMAATNASRRSPHRDLAATNASRRPPGVDLTTLALGVHATTTSITSRMDLDTRHKLRQPLDLATRPLGTHPLCSSSSSNNIQLCLLRVDLAASSSPAITSLTVTMVRRRRRRSAHREATTLVQGIPPTTTTSSNSSRIQLRLPWVDSATRVLGSLPLHPSCVDLVASSSRATRPTTTTVSSRRRPARQDLPTLVQGIQPTVSSTRRCHLRLRTPPDSPTLLLGSHSSRRARSLEWRPHRATKDTTQPLLACLVSKSLSNHASDSAQGQGRIGRININIHHHEYAIRRRFLRRGVLQKQAKETPSSGRSAEVDRASTLFIAHRASSSKVSTD